MSQSLSAWTTMLQHSQPVYPCAPAWPLLASTAMRASVIVCTRNRSDSVADTLEALSKMECPDFEILVVDNSSDLEKEKTAKMCKKFGAKYIFEPRRGLNIARNTGFSNAIGHIIAFTDDDCLPEKDWLTNKLRNFSDPSVWACTGRVVQHNREGASDLFEEVAGQDLGGTKRTFTGKDVRFGAGFLLANVLKVFSKHMKASAPVPFGIGHGSSMAFRKEVFEIIGGFDERFGSGMPMGGCDDIDMLYRVLKSGHSVVYEPSAIVRHKHRFAPEDVFQTRYGYSRSGAVFMREHRKDALMFFMFYGRLLQLAIKSAQYKLLGKKDLAKSFAADLRGFLEGWVEYRKFSKSPHSQIGKPLPLRKNHKPVG
jgi:glycosyltransferase involved in cell wall biosynthesis